MNFFDQLQTETEQQRVELFSAPIITRALQGDVTTDDYIAFLSQAYHHVKHTVPLLMATGSRLPEELEWLRVGVGEYIEEETGHQEWVLNDVAACGADKEQVRRSKPNLATELMVSYAYDTVHRINPLGFFGMVHVLEGTSISLADSAADNIRSALSLPKDAFTYLYSHGSLDQDHVEFFKGLMNRIDRPEDQAQIVDSAKVFYKLYGDIFRSLTN
jgi:pyrroloquinoline quinone (PQQ) biosynthesis protein C